MLPNTSLPPQQLKQRALIQRLCGRCASGQGLGHHGITDAAEREPAAAQTQQHHNSST